MSFRLLFCLISLSGWSLWCSAQDTGLIISEVQSSNFSTIADEEGDHEDWLELHNTSSDVIDLSGWSLTDDPYDLRKWLLTNGSIEADGYLVVFASDKNRRAEGSPLHTNFKLSASGDYLALCDPLVRIVTELNPVPTMGTDSAYGFFNGSWMLYGTPSPGKPNTVTGIIQYPAPVFSVDHGFFNEPFRLTMTCALADATIFYTTDGSAPSTLNGRPYTSGLDITGTSVIRAIAIGPTNSVPTRSNSKITTRTYLFANDIIRQSNTPVNYPSTWGKYCQISGTAVADYEMDTELMALEPIADSVKQAFQELPVISLVTDKDHLFNQVNDPKTGGIYIFTGTPVGDTTGLGWERPVSLEYFFARDSSSLQVDCGIQLHGGHSRLPEKSPKHSFRIDFQSEYGNSKLHYPLFGSDGPRVINSFFLRAGFGTSWTHQTAEERMLAIYSRDTWTKLTQRRMGNLGTHTIYAHLFINGIYWGLYNPMERIDNDFGEYWLGGHKDEYDIIKVDDTKNAVFASDGTLDAWKSLIKNVASATDPAVYQKIQGRNLDRTVNPDYPCLIDLDNFIDYMLLNFYGGNSDWDHHNWLALRNTVTPGKGFQFLCWDSEHMIKYVDANNVLSENHANCPSNIYQQLKKNPLFCRLFGDRVQKHCFNDGWLTPQKAAETWTALVGPIERSLFAESARWGDYRKDVHPWSSTGEWYRKDVQFAARKKYMLDVYFPNRTDTLVNQLKYAGLFPAVEAPSFKVNGLKVTSDTLKEGDKLSLTAPQGMIYYSLDGTDPVRWYDTGVGSLSTSSIQFVYPFAPDSGVCVKARSYYNKNWSALNEKTFVFRDLSADLTRETRLLNQVTAGCFPNPFRAHTTFRYTSPFGGQVRIEIFDVSGRRIATLLDGYQEAGSREVSFNGSALSSGVYVCRFSIQGKLSHQSVFRFVKL